MGTLARLDSAHAIVSIRPLPLVREHAVRVVRSAESLCAIASEMHHCMDVDSTTYSARWGSRWSADGSVSDVGEHHPPGWSDVCLLRNALCFLRDDSYECSNGINGTYAGATSMVCSHDTACIRSERGVICRRYSTEGLVIDSREYEGQFDTVAVAEGAVCALGREGLSCGGWADTNPR